MNHWFKILESDIKSIITYNFSSENIKIDDYSQVKPIFNITYKDPVVKEIKTYLVQLNEYYDDDDDD